MGAVRITILVVAAVIAVGLALVVGKLVSHKPAPVTVAQIAPAKPMTQVVIAHRDLPVGTRLSAGDLAWQPWPLDSVNPTFITNGKSETPAPATNPTAVAAQKAANAASAAATAVSGGGAMASLYGAVVREPILANEPVTNAKLVRGGQGGYMAVVLQPGMRAMALPVTITNDAGGFVLPGDHVDVLQAHTVPGGSGPNIVSETVLRNVRVLAIDQSSQPPKNGQSVVGAVATIEVAASDAELVARTRSRGEVVLALRSYADAGGPSGSGGGEAGGVVHVIRNGLTSDVMVTP